MIVKAEVGMGNAVREKDTVYVLRVPGVGLLKVVEDN
jgi:hypothetical protein